MDNMLQSSTNSLWLQLDTLHWPGEAEARGGAWQLAKAGLGRQEEEEIKEHAYMQNELVLIKKDVDEAYMNQVELKSRLEGLTNEFSWRYVYEEEIHEM